MHLWTKACSGWLLGNSLLLMPQVAFAQTSKVLDMMEIPQSVTPLVKSTTIEDSPEIDEGLTPDIFATPEVELELELEEGNLWTWSTLAEGPYLLSSSTDPNAESEMFSFFEKEDDLIWGVRFISHPDAVPTCFQGRVQANNRATDALSAVAVNPQEWYFNGAPLDFSRFPYQLETLPSDWTAEQVTEQISRCRAVLAPIQIDRERTLVLGVLSYLPLDRVRTLPDGSYFNEYEFNGRSGQRVRISSMSEDFDTYLILLDAEGTRVASNDDFEGDKNAEINVELSHAGRYRVIANTYDFLGEGDFMLTITTED